MLIAFLSKHVPPTSPIIASRQRYSPHPPFAEIPLDSFSFIFFFLCFYFDLIPGANFPLSVYSDQPLTMTEIAVPVDVQIFKATYSGVPVYEFLANGIACMRRRSDGWLNATQILKVADFDKPARTRILEREVQRGKHEKVQGGYGKYQGTWVPLERGRELAQMYKVEHLLRPILDFRPSTESPPLAPKHVTAASTKPRPKTTRAPAKKKSECLLGDLFPFQYRLTRTVAKIPSQRHLPMLPRSLSPSPYLNRCKSTPIWMGLMTTQ